MVRKLTGGGYTVIFISHKLNEVKEISDRITVLRQGKSVQTVPNDENMSVNELARLMVGREVDMTVTRKETDQSKAMLTVSHLTLGHESGSRLLNDVSFEVHNVFDYTRKGTLAVPFHTILPSESFGRRSFSTA